ncbi:MAG: outer membrane beta-barrel protein [Pseudomonadota bacterium]
MLRTPIAVTAMTLLLAPCAHAEFTLSFYTGFQTAPHSRVEGSDNTGDFSFLAEWEGRSFEPPPHYGIRATWWRNENWGFGVELNHTKVYADDDTLDDNGFEAFELTDGLNIITANAFYRWPNQWLKGQVTPYVGAGLGIAVPHVDVERGAQRTFEYQLTGPAAMWAAGASFDLNETWAIFGEYKGTYSQNEADLEGGGSFQTDIVTNALNFGVTYKF